MSEQKFDESKVWKQILDEMEMRYGPCYADLHKRGILYPLLHCELTYGGERVVRVVCSRPKEAQ